MAAGIGVVALGVGVVVGTAGGLTAVVGSGGAGVVGTAGVVAGGVVGIAGVVGTAAVAFAGTCTMTTWRTLVLVSAA